MLEQLQKFISRKFLLTVGAIIVLVLDATKVLDLGDSLRQDLIVVVLGYDLANIGAKFINQLKK